MGISWASRYRAGASVVKESVEPRFVIVPTPILDLLPGIFELTRPVVVEAISPEN
jgi:hypothetical protein